MTGPDLSTELRRRAEETASEILQAARRDAERIEAEAERVVEEHRERVLGQRENAYRREAMASIAAERREATRAVLLAKTKLVERVLERTASMLPEAIGAPAYEARMADEIAAAIAFIGSEDALIECSKALIPSVQAVLADASNATVEATDAQWSGFVASSRDGAVRVDATLESRLKRLTPTLAIEIHRRLEER